MNPYLSKFQELEIIGRGSFGSATLVKEYLSGTMFIAKKIILSGLKEKEREAALQESELLKSLSHPNIVAYKDSFMIDGTLIIIMEFCEEGDLAFHIKRKKEKKEHFSERVILNWFLQISLALIYIHERKILHRDIKTSNIFVNSNGTVKIGDFGISRVLEHTADQAQTVVGTPYYMSPEVCESKPYSQKSDVWALGCVAYELCTLKHAFTSNNLLGLVYKIVKETVEEIPAFYSNDLKNLIKKMFIKDDALRPNIRQILAQPFLRIIMEEFVENQGKNIYQSDIPIKQTNTHAQMMNQMNRTASNSGGHDSELGDTVASMNQSAAARNNQSHFTIGGTINSMNQTNANYDNTLGSTVLSIQQGGATQNTPFDQNNPNLTTKQKLDLKKKQESDAKAAILNQAVRENAAQAHLVKARKQEQLNHHHGTMARTMQAPQTPAYTMQQLSQKEQQFYNQQHSKQLASQTMGANHGYNNNLQQQQQQKQFQDMSMMTQQMGNASISQYQNAQFDVSHNQQQMMYNVPVGYGNNNNNNANKYNNPHMSGDNTMNGQSIRTDIDTHQGFGLATQKANEYYGQQEFEEYNSDEDDANDFKGNNTFSMTSTMNRLTLHAPESQRQDVVNVYKNLLNRPNNLEDISEQSGEYNSMTPSKVTKATGIQPSSTATKIDRLRQECISSLSEEVFKKAYNFIKSRKMMSEDDYASLYEIVGKNNRTKCQKIDELIYLETLN